MPNSDDKSGAAEGQQQGQNQQQSNEGDQSEKFYTKEEVEAIVGKRVSKLAKTNTDLSSRLEALEKATTKKPEGDGKDPMTDLKKEISELKKKNAEADARAARAELDKIKIKMAKKAGLPGWFDPTLLPGDDEEQIEAAIENIVDQMAEDAEADAEQKKADKFQRMKRGFGGKTPKGKETKLSGDQYMDQLMLRSIGRSGPTR